MSGSERMDRLRALHDALVSGDHLQTAALTRELLAAGEPPQRVLNDALLPAMDLVGERFREGEYFLPDVLVRARAMKAGMCDLDPLLAAGSYTPQATVVLGTVRGDVHDIGKNLVGVMLRGAGFRVVDIGTGRNDAAFLAAVEAHTPDVVGLSALLTTTMPYMRTVITTLRSAGHTVPVIVGGAPVTASFARAIGAAGTSRTAPDAVALVRELVRR